jgi:hypothetical protein
MPQTGTSGFVDPVEKPKYGPRHADAPRMMLCEARDVK